MMRFPILATLLLCAVLGATLFAVGCTTIPVSSMAKLARVDFMTTDLSTLRAAVLLPAYLKPLPGGTRLQVTLAQGGGEPLRRDLELEPIDDPEAATLNIEGDKARRFFAYKLSAGATKTLNRLRREVLKAKQDGTKGSLAISVAADACHIGPVPAGPIPVTTYLKAAETKSFVPIVRNIDLRKALPTDRFDVEPCSR